MASPLPDGSTACSACRCRLPRPAHSAQLQCASTSRLPNLPPRPVLQLAERRRLNDTAAAQVGRDTLQSSVDQLQGELQELKGAAGAREEAEQVRRPQSLAGLGAGCNQCRVRGRPALRQRQRTALCMYAVR